MSADLSRIERREDADAGLFRCVQRGAVEFRVSYVDGVAMIVLRCQGGYSGRNNRDFHQIIIVFAHAHVLMSAVFAGTFGLAGFGRWRSWGRPGW